MSDFPYIYSWGNNPKRAQLKGKRCRLIVRSKAMNSCMLEFEDGEKVITSRNAIRKAKDEQRQKVNRLV